MRKRTVKTGLNFILVAMIIITMVTFFHDELSWLFLLSPAGEAELTMTGLGIGGFFGGLGVVISAIGFLQSTRLERDVYLKPLVVILAAVFLIFVLLLYLSFESPVSPKLRPGETITI